MSKENKDMKEEALEWVKSFAVVIVLALIIKSFLFDSTTIDGTSMAPTLSNGDRLIVNKIVLRMRKPERGEIITFHAPNSNKDFIKRVIALSGDTVEFVDGKVLVNDKELDENYIDPGVYTDSGLQSYYEVPKGFVFVLGDNRNPGGSTDSRILGPIDENSIVSIAMFRFFPFTRIRNF